MALVDRLQRFLRLDASWTKGETRTIRPFDLFLPTRARDSSEKAAFAIPSEPVDRDPDQALEGMRAACRQRECPLFVRYLDEFAPDFASTLESRRFIAVERSPVLVCSPATFRSAHLVPGAVPHVVTAESTQEQILIALDANVRGFDPDAAPMTPSDAEDFREDLVEGRAFYVTIGEQAVAAGMCSAPIDGVTTLSGITTLVPFRRRGLATFLTAHMTSAAFATGVDLAFLTAVDQRASAVYERVGFRRAATYLEYRDLASP